MSLYDKIVEVQWSGVTRYKCPLCKFADDKKVRVKVHISERHFGAALEAERQSAVPAVPLFDAEGKPITQMPGREPVLKTLIEGE